MPHNITEVDTFTGTVTVPDGTDSRTGLSAYIASFVQALANRTKNLNLHAARFDVANSFTLVQTFLAGLIGQSSGSTDAVRATAAGSGRGVYATSASGIAVRGEALGGNNNGGYFVGHGTGVGCYAESPAGANSNGFYGVGNGASPAIRGDCSPGTGAGVRGEGGGSSPGGDFVGGSSGPGVVAQGGGSGARGATLTGGGGNSDGAHATGTGTGIGLVAASPSGTGADISGGAGAVISATTGLGLDVASTGATSLQVRKPSGAGAALLISNSGLGPALTLTNSVANAQIHFTSQGGGVTSPNAGDMWWDGTNLKFCTVGGITPTVVNIV